MDKRFTALRVIGTIFKILAWIWLILGILSALGVLVAGFTLGDQQMPLGLDVAGPLTAIAAFVAILIITILYFLILYAAGESIYLILSIEESTRRVAYFAQQQYTSQQPAYPSPPSPRAYTE